MSGGWRGEAGCGAAGGGAGGRVRHRPPGRPVARGAARPGQQGVRLRQELLHRVRADDDAAAAGRDGAVQQGRGVRACDVRRPGGGRRPAVGVGAVDGGEESGAGEEGGRGLGGGQPPGDAAGRLAHPPRLVRQAGVEAVADPGAGGGEVVGERAYGDDGPVAARLDPHGREAGGGLGEGVAQRLGRHLDAGLVRAGRRHQGNSSLASVSPPVPARRTATAVPRPVVRSLCAGAVKRGVGTGSAWAVGVMAGAVMMRLLSRRAWPWRWRVLSGPDGW